MEIKIYYKFRNLVMTIYNRTKFGVLNILKIFLHNNLKKFNVRIIKLRFNKNTLEG